MSTELEISNCPELSTITDFIRWGASRFVEADLSYSHGLSSPLDEAAYLVLRSLSLPVDTPDVYWSSALTAKEKSNVVKVIKTRVTDKIPAAYIFNEGWFAGLQFFVDERVLVPRSPIAELVENQFSPWVDADDVLNILDLCTGSGCIGIACAYAFPLADVDLSDVSPEALEVANINIDGHDARQRVTAIESNIFSNLQGKQYDIIVSNPPYVDAEDMTDLPQEFHHEPELGLSSGADGLDLTRVILQQAAEHLTENGVLVVEVGNSQFSLMELYPEMPFQWVDFERGGDGVFVLTKQQLENLK
ncbi:MAG: 50S ribosomal protein L3 N(5)-glutamine methyltransferase [Cocleimonas sp.]